MASERKVTIEYPVSVTVEWPEGMPYSDEVAMEVAYCVVSQSCEREVELPSGETVWAKCYAEVLGDDAEIIEGGGDEDGWLDEDQ